MEDRAGSPALAAVAAELAEAISEFEVGPLLDTPQSVSRAWSNEVWRVVGGSGTAFAIKLFPQELSESRRRQLQAGVQLELLVLERHLVLMPQPVAAASGWLVELQGTPPRLARCHEWVDGQQAKLPLIAESIQAAGTYLGRLHAIDLPGGDTAQLAPLDLQRWSRAVESSQETGLGWADQLADLTPIVEALAADLEKLRAQRRPMRLSHRDYDPKNALIDLHGQLVITDWDYAGPVIPEVELIVGATSFAETDDEVVLFVEAYCEAGGTAVATDSLAMTAESADLDWLLRNVEGSVTNPDDDSYATAATLIAALPHAVTTNSSWADRLPHLLSR